MRIAIRLTLALFPTLLIYNSSGNADTSTVCNWSGGQIKIDGNKVTIGNETFRVGDSEKISKASSTGASAFVGGSGTQCRATSHKVSTGKNGETVILEMHRSKPSQSGGLLCGMSSDLSKFANPYRYTQTVVWRDSTGRWKIKSIEVADGSGRPDLSADQLLDPNLTDGALKPYIADQPHLVTIKNEICGNGSSTDGPGGEATVRQ